jgi:hypothetical protein
VGLLLACCSAGDPAESENKCGLFAELHSTQLPC